MPSPLSIDQIYATKKNTFVVSELPLIIEVSVSIFRICCYSAAREIGTSSETVFNSLHITFHEIHPGDSPTQTDGQRSLCNKVLFSTLWARTLKIICCKFVTLNTMRKKSRDPLSILQAQLVSLFILVDSVWFLSLCKKLRPHYVRPFVVCGTEYSSHPFVDCESTFVASVTEIKLV